MIVRTFLTKIATLSLVLTLVLPIECQIHEIKLDRHNGDQTEDMPGNGHIFSISDTDPSVRRFSQEKQLSLGWDEKRGRRFEITPDSLLDDERKIFDQLGPIYQKIYLFAFNNEQRQRVVHYVNGGLDPYDAVNIIVNVEQRKHKQCLPKKRSLTPAERSTTRRLPRKEILGLE